MTLRATAPEVRRGTGCPCPLPCTCSYTTLLRARARASLRGEPLLRNGHVLTLSSLATAGLGGIFWILATSWYSVDTVGSSYAALSVVLLLSGIGQLNLGDVLVRFVPAAGRHTRRVVLRCYAASTLCSVLAAGAFLALQPVLAPDLGFLRNPSAAAGFVVATAGYSLFVLQDGALTGLRRPGLVLGENTVFAVAKAALLAVFAALAVGTGILYSWAVALVLSLVVTNAVLFRRAVPRHEEAAPTAAAPTGLARYAAADYLGSLFRMAAYGITPLLVLDSLGTEGNGYFALAWVIAYTFYLVALNMGSSLIVEAAHAPERLSEQARRVLRHAALPITAGVVVVVALAPWLLHLFGDGYEDRGATTLRLLALSALPNLVLSIAVDVARARRQLVRVVGLQAALCVLVLSLTVWLLPLLDVTGVGVAWLVGESALAVPLLVTLPRWLPVTRRTA